MITFRNDGEVGMVATKKEISFIIEDSIFGPFPNDKEILNLLLRSIRNTIDKNEDETLNEELTKKLNQFKAEREI